jgi:ABC-type uncharacterized transport system substrate-binding protein
MRIEDQVGDQKFRWQIYLRHIVALVRVPERSLGLRVVVLKVSTSNEIDAAFVTLGRERPDALWIDCGQSNQSISARSRKQLVSTRVA